MRGVFWFLVLMSMASLVVITGCKDSVPRSDLDLFMAAMDELPAATQADSLRAIAAGDRKRASYANYFMGNSHYAAASDTARLQGWSAPGANAQLDSAEVYFSRAVAQDSSFVEALVNLGSLWDDRSEQMIARTERDKHVAKAKEYYELALKVDPLDEKARCNLGGMYLRQGKRHEAKLEFNQVLEDNPRSALAHYNLAIMFAEAKIYREAITEWELAVKFDPKGDIGERSRDNIKIVKDLMKTPVPTADPKAGKN